MSLSLTYSLVKREILARYKGSSLGILWSLITPLIMLAVYTFVFGTIFRTKWPGTSEDASMAEYAILLFAGLLTFQLLADVAMRAPRLILENQSYVKKVVFPLKILVPVTLGTALFHMVLSLVVLLAANAVVSGSVQWTTLLLPVIILPYCVMILGIGWLLAALGVYLRDISEVMAPLITSLMFLSPIFIPSSALPEWLQPFLKFNPITVPVTEVRNLVIWGELPDIISIGIYSVVAVLVAGLGYWFFQKTRTGFADVI